jgi:hypothetical protein
MYAKDVTPFGERKSAYRVLVGYLTEIDHSEGPGLEGRTILKWVLKQ